MGKMMREWEAEQRAARETARGEREAQEAARKPAPDYDPGLWVTSKREQDEPVTADLFTACVKGNPWGVVCGCDKCDAPPAGGAP